jgi:hypothetical protein
MTASPIARLKITLDHVKPPVRRRVEVPLALGLDQLHLVIQAAMGWTNDHLYEFRAGDVGWGQPDPDWADDMLDAGTARLGDLIGEGRAKTLRYTYDFGDGWDHTIKVERIAEAAPGVAYPRLIDAVGRCPPEDIGGPWGYAEFLEAIGDPKHERHDELMEWIGEEFDTTVDSDALTDDVDDLAKQWSRKPPARRRARP